MRNVRIIPPGRNLIEEVAEIASTGGRDLSGTLVVFPGRRPAHFLRKVLAGRIGSGYRPPRILSYDDFIDLGYRSIQSAPTRVLEPLDAVSVLHAVHLDTSDRIGSDHFTNLDAFLPLGLKLYDELEELHRADLSPRQIRESIGGLSFGSYHLIPQYYEQFYEKVKISGFITPAGKLRTVADGISRVTLAGYDTIVLAGFYALTSADRRIFGDLAGRTNVLLVFQQGKNLRNHLRAIGIEAEETEIEGEDDRKRYHLCSAPDIHGQVFALTEKINTLHQRGEIMDERTAIILPSPNGLFPVLHQALTLLPEKGYNISLRFPLSRTPAYGFLSALLQVLSSGRNGRFSVMAYVRFILHPYVKNIRFGKRTDITRILFHTIENQISRKRFGVSVGLEDLEEDGRVFALAARGGDTGGEAVLPADLKMHLKAIHDRTLRAVLHPESLKDFADRCIRVLQFIEEKSTASQHPFFTPYAQRLAEVLQTLSTSPLSSQSLSDLPAYERFLRFYIEASHVPFPRSSPLGGVQVLGLLETRNLSFDRVFVLDANDDDLPPATAQETLIPQALREKLGLETRKDRETLTEYYFDILRRSGREVHFFFTESGKKEKSRFLQKLVWQWEQEDRKIHEGQYTQSVRYSVRLSNPAPSAVTKTGEMVDVLKRMVYSATALDTYLACQLRFYYRYVLNLAERDAATGDIDQRDIGILVHKVLRRLYEPALEQVLTEKFMEKEKLSRLVDEVCEESFGQDLSGVPSLVKVQVERQLSSFVDEYQIPMLRDENIELMALELPVSIMRGGYVFEGRIDRVERRGPSVVILDYKTGKNDEFLKIRFDKLDVHDRNTWPDAIGSLQLPMYMFLYSASAGVSMEQIRPAYLFLGRMKMGKEIEVGLQLDSISHQEAGTLLEKIIIQTVNEISDQSRAFERPSDLRKTCPDCEFQSICGTQWTSDPKHLS